MQITLNGKPYTIPQPVSILELSVTLQLEPTQVAIEHNSEIIPRSLYDKTMLNDGDMVEIVTFIGGG
ncbi:MAG: sulfur carrier protein ThiS [Rickettsiales bacterium]|jgi:sulfur carrier protein